MDLRAEEALEELHLDSDRRNAAHAVTMAVARSLPIDRGYLFQCRWCERSWLMSDDGARLEPKNHHETCAWRLAKLYAADVAANA